MTSIGPVGGRSATRDFRCRTAGGHFNVCAKKAVTSEAAGSGAPGLQPRAPQISWGAEMHPHPRGLAAGVEEKEEGEGPMGVKVRFHPETSSSAVTSSGVTCSHKKFMRATAFSSSDQSPGYSDTPWGVTN